MQTMPCIDFDSHFADYLADWTREHMRDYKTYDEMEDDLPKVYLRFLNTPAPWLDGLTPGSYFTQFEDPKDLVDWLSLYLAQDVPVPDLLLEQIRNVGKPCEKRLLALLRREPVIDNTEQMLAVELLRELESDKPKMLYLDWMKNPEISVSELADNAAESLKDMGPSAVPAMLEALPACTDAGKDILLDILSNYPGNERVFRMVLERFEAADDDQRLQLYSDYLTRLADDRALPALCAAAMRPELGYAAYIDIRCAIEALGGEAPERDFSDAPDIDYF